MRRRYKEGGLKKYKGFWIAQWWEDGHRRNRILGRVSMLTKAEAMSKLDRILGPLNLRQSSLSVKVKFRDFVTGVFLPFHKRKWKPSTAATNQERINYHLVMEIGGQTLGGVTRDDLQTLLEQKASAGRSHSLVDHLRWDLKQIFDLAWAEGLVSRNPAAALFTPRHARRYPRLVMNLDQVRRVFSVLGLRERLIVKLAILAGLRPGEIFGLTWDRVYRDFLEIRQRVYRGKVDTPKTSNSVRKVAVSTGLSEEINQWREVAFDTKPGA